MPAKKDLTGLSFGALTVIGESNKINPAGGHRYWIVRCDCGNKKTVSAQTVKSYNQSCTCYQNENIYVLNTITGEQNVFTSMLKVGKWLGHSQTTIKKIIDQGILLRGYLQIYKDSTANSKNIKKEIKGQVIQMPKLQWHLHRPWI
jgi:hypothetical protein